MLTFEVLGQKNKQEHENLEYRIWIRCTNVVNLLPVVNVQCCISPVHFLAYPRGLNIPIDSA